MSYPTNDLSQILQILAASNSSSQQHQQQQFPPPPQLYPQQQQTPQPNGFWQPPPPPPPPPATLLTRTAPPQQVYAPPVLAPQQQPYYTPTPAQHAHPHTPPPQPYAAAAPKPAKPTRPDPSTITTLAAARRYIALHLAPDPQFRHYISVLKVRQHAQERDWCSARSAIIKRHAQREETGKKLQGILANLGVVPGGGDADTMMGVDEELRVFDRKVWVRCVDMVRIVEAELAKCGVPLFCSGSGSGGEVDGKVMGEWKKEVVELLEDLCSEDGE